MCTFCASIIQPKQNTVGASDRSALDFFKPLSTEGATCGPAKRPISTDKKEDDISGSDADDNSDIDDKSDASEDDKDAVQLLQSGRHGNKEGAPRKKRKKEKRTIQKLAQIKREQMSHFRHQHHIHVHGTDLPDPVATFKELQESYSIHPQLMRNVAALGFDSPTPIQMQAIPAMLQGRELLACAPTGSGKTAAFILPILHMLKQPKNCGFRALVLSPTRELAKQTHREFCHLAEGRGFRIHIIEKSSTAAKKFGPNSSQKFDILVSTPSRLVYLLKQEPPLLSLSNIEWLIVDESDKLFEEGKTGFRDQLATIYKACDAQCLRRAMFSATFARDVEEWCKLNLDNVIQVYIGAKNVAAESVKQELVFVGSEAGKLIAMRDIIRKGIQPPVLVFVQSKERAKELFHELIYDGINVDVIHADRPQLQRDNVVKSFRLGNIWVLICTELMGRGIDFKGVNLVVNYDFPNSAVSYIHRIGRTGRAGREGRAVTFFTEDDALNLRSIANVMKQAGCPVPDYMLKIGRPTQKTRKKMAKSTPRRAPISTLPTDDSEKTDRKRKLKERKSKVKQKKRAQNEGVSGAADTTKLPGKGDNHNASTGSDAKSKGKFRKTRKEGKEKTAKLGKET
ncbi:hypothetical protein NP493_409g08051 [Ridgeia piscesae]|uniref:Probable ATP-dependent RNA helicase DDX52 n=1 Tax=Ridgeia piscesae TaxID=27915 RepID=A0AAD9NVH1_RIDPI|nr:hypothetical protein NP493_409g08051 [Ridgeia piscesae]